MIVYGEHEKLLLIPQLEIFEQLRIEAKLDHAILFIVPAIFGDRVAETMALFEQFAKELEKEPAFA